MFRDVECNRIVLRDNGLFLLSTKKTLLLVMLTGYLTRLTTVPLNCYFPFGMKLSVRRMQRLIQDDVHSYGTGSCCYRRQYNSYDFK
jgi:hypothetical protein